MYKVVIFCGGSGSIAIQQGFAQLFGADTVRLYPVVNAFDNGLSTGACRKVFSGQIPGPSDLRKNQFTQYEIRYAKQLENQESLEARRYSFMTLRFSADSYEAYYQKAERLIVEQDYLTKQESERLRRLLRYFFYEGDQIRETVRQIQFENFSLFNIFYASAAALSGGSLSAAATEMAALISIPDNVLLISDKSLFLHARTKSGHIIEDEGEIVCWNDPDDKIVHVFLTDTGRNIYQPVTGEGITGYDVSEVIAEADLIICSSGTQWSSMIPTYMHSGFREAVSRSGAKKYLVMNNREDGDMYGTDAEEICRLAGRYLDLSSFTIVINNRASEGLRSISSDYRVLYGDFSSPGALRHDPLPLVTAIMEDYFGRELFHKKQYMFDLDGTLWDASLKEAGERTGVENLNLFPGRIVSGNSREHLGHILNRYCRQNRDIAVYCDYGNTQFQTDPWKQIRRLTDRYDLEASVSGLLESQPEYKGKCELRGGVVLTIRPLTDREKHLKNIRVLLRRYHGKYTGKIAGKTSIDVTHAQFSKAGMVSIIMERERILPEDLLYVGNELQEGNEKEITGLGIQTLQVRDIYECNVFLKLLRRLGQAGMSVKEMGEG